MLTSILLSVVSSVSFSHATVPACTIEDASSGPVPCVWLASSAGNGEGFSFRVYRNGNYSYITNHAAKRLLGII